MKSLNPGFRGAVRHKVKDNEIIELAFSSAGITDISPVRAFPRLEILRLLGTSNAAEKTLVDLSPLRGLRLWCLEAKDNSISDLSSLQGMPLRILRCSDNPIKDLMPLKGMPLGEIHIANTEVSDLSPLVGMPLTKLVCQQSRVTNLLPLKVFDLKLLRCDFVIERDAITLRSIKTLEQINGLRAEEFWKRADSGESPQAK
jgi:Leucine-rich repeat (LRR) protein